MKLWRISNYKDLAGVGGLKTPGRWHNRGIPVVYLAETPALAMLEVLVHFELGASEVPENYQLLEVEFSGRKGVSRLNDEDLKKDWKDNIGYTRAVGDEWLTLSNSVLLRVPSAVVPHSYNYLFNPRHVLSSNAKIISAIKHPFDSRFI